MRRHRTVATRTKTDSEKFLSPVIWKACQTQSPWQSTAESRMRRQGSVTARRSIGFALLIFLDHALHNQYAQAQSQAGIHCAVGTGSCGNWLELGGYKTSCELAVFIMISTASIMTFAKRTYFECECVHTDAHSSISAGAECGGEPQFISQPIPGAPDPQWCGVKYVGYERGGNWKTLKPVWRYGSHVDNEY